ncbi:N-acetyl-1-D-myo-inositol-2-amino-2-deoxy-alpha-D-glucopyranoside deacetylase [Streptacidiphilus cavernicola]|uniref:1D-myo-inositol 2-acetamido-2-deoxy-alpha-D-glucopyranoside deacetylase n=1 Tax=Streptacidiphilus cavernicola TaxID=3342716 RepID=A0ABV6VUJ5_9ACTN
MTALPDAPSAARRLLLVHAHPDDESIGNGATMARYAAEGALVTLVTCTLGEEGEVIGPELRHLAADRDDALGGHRAGELAEAMAALGVTDHRILGGPGRYRDSGMMGVPSNKHPDCFWQADLDQAAAELVAVVRETRPDVLVTYDENGGYGHPDHIQAHRVAMRAYDLAADPDFRPELGPAHDIAKVYWNCVPKSVLDAGTAALRAAGEQSPFAGVAGPGDVPGVVPDELVTTAVEGGPHTARKVAAMHAHRTQITVDGPFFALSNDLGQPLPDTEFYRLVRGEAAPAEGSAREDDLFAGLEAEPLEAERPETEHSDNSRPNEGA